MKSTLWLLPVMFALASSARASDHEAAFGACAQDISFVGFSRNERVMALRTVLRCARPDHSADALRIIALVDTQNGKHVASFYETAPYNAAGGARSLLKKAELTRLYPALRRAGSVGAWQRIYKAGRFKAHRHDFSDASVRLRVAGDKPVRLHPRGGALNVTARQALRFEVVAHLSDGSQVDLARLNFVPDAKGAATLEVHVSSPGHRAVVLWHNGGHTKLASYSTPGDVRLGDNSVGVINVLSATADEVESIYKDMHPTSAKAWDEIVGEGF